eukprot:8542232-Karenia_brevis.AAC.1
MKIAFEKLYGRLQGDETPSRAYLGLKTTDVEEDEPKAERLSEQYQKKEIPPQQGHENNNNNNHN